ncbi:MAG TPA: radical SAM protein [Gemmatimonadales bacterium]|nr:radical SAM protein [Gemmatimonadales bacterium]
MTHIMREPIAIHPHRPQADGPAIVGDEVELQLFTTLQCNLKCSYCSESVGEVRGSAGHVGYPIAALRRFVDTHLAGLAVYATFYGGEPTLNVAFMGEVMREFPGFGYQLQTNGTLLHRVPGEILARLDNILVSVDGGRETTDGYRGRGVYNRVMRNLARVRGQVRGTLTARVTWGHAGTTLEEIEGLLESFDYVYFQFAHRDDVYGPADLEAKRRVLARMVERFFERGGDYPIVPVMGIVRNKALPHLAGAGPDGLTQCRVSTHIINVLPDGSIYPCPDMVWDPQMRQGSVTENRLSRSALQPHRDMPCEGCEAFAWCRRNCMKNLHVAYVKRDEHYRRRVVEPICELVRFMGREVDRHRPASWLREAPAAVREEVAGSRIYRYVEVMP